MEENTTIERANETKFCKECGKTINRKAVICPYCGCQVENIKEDEKKSPQIVINNSNQSSNVNTNVNQNNNGRTHGRIINKWVALLLCFFLGFFGAHKFYEGKTGMGILYIFTFGLFFIGVIIDFIVILFKPNPYYV